MYRDILVIRLFGFLLLLLDGVRWRQSLLHPLELNHLFVVFGAADVGVHADQ